MQSQRVEEIIQVLENEIASGDYPPGTRLEELVLASRFQVSRTPVREALKTLAASGLIDLQPRKGAVVARLSLERLVEMFEAMAELEGICGRLAARRMTPEEQTALLRQHELCGDAARSGDTDNYYRENARFHELIYAGCHNSCLAEQVRHLRRRLQPYRRLQLRLKGRVANSYAEHCAVIDAITSGEEETAWRTLRSHVSIQGDRFADWVSSLNAMRMAGGTAA